MTAYYSENDPKAAAWLRELIARGHIAPGDVDTRSILDVSPDDLRPYTQCHFFAGIGVWSYALRCAGWPDDRPVWTGSCPCQPFSAAGKGGGFDDERHLWPAWQHLIAECRPPVVFGEQVASAAVIGGQGGKRKAAKRAVLPVSSTDGPAWLDSVFAGMEDAHYACGAIAAPACSVGAPHIRQRLYFVGERLGQPDGAGSQPGWLAGKAARHGRSAVAAGGAGRLGHDDDEGPQGHAGHDGGTGRRALPARSVAPAGVSGGMGDAAFRACERNAGGLLGEEAPFDGAGVGIDGSVDLGFEYAGPSVRGMALPDGRHASAKRLQRSREHGQQPEDGRTGGLAESAGSRRDWRDVAGVSTSAGGDETAASDKGRYGNAVTDHSANGGLADDDDDSVRRGRGRSGEAGAEPGAVERSGGLRDVGSRPGPVNGVWRNADWLYCTDARWRPVETGTFPLAHGAPARVGRLRGYGNGLVAPHAQGFIEAYLETKAVEGEVIDDRHLRLNVDIFG